jgi:type IV pilus assembly protein PilC
MPVYTYRGVNRAGATVVGERSATSKTEAATILKREQINVSKLSEKGKEFNIPTFGTGVDSKELAIFTRQFSVMIDAGLPLVQCLEILAGQRRTKSCGFYGVRASVKSCPSFNVLTRQVFDPLYSRFQARPYPP